MLSEIIFFSSLLLCIALGSHYKNIGNKELKRNYGTGLGFLITFLICGYQMYHSLLMTWGNIIIIKCCDKRYLHQISLIYTLMYLTYLVYCVENVTYMLWVNQAIALRLVGLAFEINTSYKLKYEANKLNIPALLKLSYVNEDNIPEDAKAVDIISYTYYFIGLHKGPYYRWKIFNDHFETPIGNQGDCRKITEQKLRKAVIYGLIYLFIRANFPIQLYYEKEFYEEYGADMRYLYNVPQLLMYVLYYELVSVLCTAVCTESGFGGYPVICKAVPGHGPTTNFSFLSLAATKQSVAAEQEYSFAMLNSFDNELLLIGPRMRDTLRGWDMSTRYWFWAHIHKCCVNKATPEIRSALSFTAWSLWCGLTIPQIIILCTLWVHVHLEKEYSELYNTSKSMKMPWDIGFTIMRAFCLIYLTPCLILPDSSTLLIYYNSLFWIFHILLLISILCALCAHKYRLFPSEITDRTPGHIACAGVIKQSQTAARPNPPLKTPAQSSHGTPEQQPTKSSPSKGSPAISPKETPFQSPSNSTTKPTTSKTSAKATSNQSPANPNK